MGKKRWKRIGAVVLILSLWFVVPNEVRSTQVQQVETNGSIGFMKGDDPIGEPDPTPEEIKDPPKDDQTKPGGRLPQTNTQANHWFVWLGLSIFFFVFLSWKQKKKQDKPKTT